MKGLKTFLLLAAIGIVLLLGYLAVRQIFKPARYLRVLEWIRNPEAHPE